MLKPLFLGIKPDYFAYYTGAKLFLAGKNIYVPSSGTAFIYPPFALFFIIPFVLLPYGLSQTLWTGMSIAAFFISLILLLKLESEKLFSNRFLLLFGLACYSFPAKFTLGMGQINMLILLLVTLFLYLLKSNKLQAAAATLGLSLNTKFFPFFFILAFLLKKQWKIFLYTVSFSLVFFALAVLIFHLQSLTQFMQTILPGIINSTRSDYYNQALSGFVFRMLPVSALSETIIRFVSLIFFLVTCFVLWRTRKEQLPVAFGLLITLHLLIDSFSWQHYFVWLLIPYVQIMYTLLRRKFNWGYYIPLVLSYFLTQTNMAHPASFPVLLQSHVFYGTLLLWGYILYILLNHAKHTVSD